MAGKQLLIPREHGAWATLMMPFIVGVGVAGRLLPETMLFLLAAVCCFAARHPLGLAIKEWTAKAGTGRVRTRQRAVLLWLAGYVLLAGSAAALLLLAFGRWALLPIGVLALLLLVVQQTLQRRRLDRTVLGELLAFGGLALTGPGAYYASTGLLDAMAAHVWLLTFLYAGASVFYVKLRIKQRAQRTALDLRQRRLLGLDMALYLTVLLATLGLLAATGQIPWLAPLAFLPLTVKVVRAIWRANPELSVRRLGFIELGHSTAFTVLLIVAYNLG